MPERVDVFPVASREAERNVALGYGGEEMVRYQSWVPITPGLCPISTSVWYQRQSPRVSTFTFLLMFFVLFCFISLFYFTYFWLCCVFAAACGLSLVAVSGGYSSLQCTGFALWWLLIAEHGL